MSETKREVTEYIRGRFKADGRKIYKEGDVKRYSDGTSSMGLSAPALEVAEYMVEPERLAEWVAEALNERADRDAAMNGGG